MSDYSPVNKHCGCNHCGDYIDELEAQHATSQGIIDEWTGVIARQGLRIAELEAEKDSALLALAEEIECCKDRGARIAELEAENEAMERHCESWAKDYDAQNKRISNLEFLVKEMWCSPWLPLMFREKLRDKMNDLFAE